ncbi:MAG: ABC transporter ATP-binding protein [Planctomycetes bacterium]|nr:ABC transporter ATP-binding protein [Planctomycetota bacterium]
MAELEVQHVAKAYPTRAAPLVVLRDVTFQMRAGENLAILGPSGSGKSTLLHVLGTLEPPSSGSVRLAGVDPTTLRETELAAFRNRNLGFIFQEHFLLPQLTVLENVLVPSLAAGSPNRETLDRAADLLRRVGLLDRTTHRPAELSGGERQRVAVARALLLKPRLVLADEPTGSLDRSNARAVGELLLELQRDEGNLLIVVTHSRELARLMQSRKELDNGLLIDGDSSDTAPS